MSVEWGKEWLVWHRLCCQKPRALSCLDSLPTPDMQVPLSLESEHTFLEESANKNRYFIIITAVMLDKKKADMFV